MFMSVSSGFSDEMAGLAATRDYVQDLSGNAQQVAMNEAKVGTEQHQDKTSLDIRSRPARTEFITKCKIFNYFYVLYHF